ncbi:hypothetical protein LTR74_015572 [Friedmanniomyces endolithicus]|nr:hypothetical protein LTR74_015572 [Friedmanniomyces endolithicus]
MSSSEEEKDELMAEQADEHALEIEAFLSSDDLPEPRRIPFGLTSKSTFSVVTNVAPAVGLASVNKRLFEDAALRHATVTFAAIHFAVTAATLYVVTAATLYVVSIPPLALFQRKHVGVLQMLPLAVATHDVTVWWSVSLATWAVIMLVCYGARNGYRSPSADSRCRRGGFLACLLHVSQFLIVDCAGPIASTVVGHAMACPVITIG